MPPYQGRRSVVQSGGTNAGKREITVGIGSLLGVWGRCKGAKHVFSQKYRYREHIIIIMLIILAGYTIQTLCLLV